MIGNTLTVTDWEGYGVANGDPSVNRLTHPQFSQHVQVSGTHMVYKWWSLCSMGVRRIFHQNGGMFDKSGCLDARLWAWLLGYDWRSSACCMAINTVETMCGRNQLGLALRAEPFEPSGFRFQGFVSKQCNAKSNDLSWSRSKTRLRDTQMLVISSVKPSHLKRRWAPQIRKFASVPW